MRFIEDQKWRYATKKFDSSKKISNADLELIKEAIQLTPTSYGLQLFKVLIVENKQKRDLLLPVSWGQSQITDASHLLIICNYTDVSEEHINSFASIKAKANKMPVENLDGYIRFIQSQISELSPEQIERWTAKQTYIALGNLLSACAELKIDSCPMEGFEADKYDEILGLSEKGLAAAIVCPIGYRSEEDATKDAPKVRRSKEDLFEVV